MSLFTHPQAAIIARLKDPVVCKNHGRGLWRAIRLCERFINAHAATSADFTVLRKEVERVLLDAQRTPRHLQVGDAECCTATKSDQCPHAVAMPHIFHRPQASNAGICASSRPMANASAAQQLGCGEQQQHSSRAERQGGSGAHGTILRSARVVQVCPLLALAVHAGAAA